MERGSGDSYSELTEDLVLLFDGRSWELQFRLSTGAARVFALAQRICQHENHTQPK